MYARPHRWSSRKVSPGASNPRGRQRSKSLLGRPGSVLKGAVLLRGAREAAGPSFGVCVEGVYTNIQRSEKSSPVSFPRCCPPCVVRQGLSLSWTLTAQLDWLVIEPQGSAYFCLPDSPMIVRVHRHAWLFMYFYLLFVFVRGVNLGSHMLQHTCGELSASSVGWGDQTQTCEAGVFTHAGPSTTGLFRGLKPRS